MVCDSARTSVTPAPINMAMKSIMKVFLMMENRNGGEMLSEEKAQRVMGKRVAQCRTNTGDKQKSWKADVVGSNLGVESDLICI